MVNTKKKHTNFKNWKEQASNSSDEQCEDDDEEDDDSYYDEDGQMPAAMVTSTEKSTTQSTISNNGSGATLSIRNSKSVSKKSKPAINVRADKLYHFVFVFYSFKFSL